MWTGCACCTNQQNQSPSFLELLSGKPERSRQFDCWTLKAVPTQGAEGSRVEDVQWKMRICCCNDRPMPDRHVEACTLKRLLNMSCRFHCQTQFVDSICISVADASVICQLTTSAFLIAIAEQKVAVLQNFFKQH